MILYIQTFSYLCTGVGSSPSPVRIDGRIKNNLQTKLFRLLPEEQSLGRGAVGGGDDKEHDKNHDDQQQHVTSYSQRHPNYYYTNGNRVSGNTKSAYSYYDYNDDDSYYSRHSGNGQRNKLYSYTTKLSDVYWCLLIALGWTIWMIHSIASLRQQHYATMLSISERGINDTTMMLTPNADTMRIFRTNFTSLLLVRGHVLDVISKPVIATDAPVVRAPTCTVVIDYVVERQLQPLLSPTTTTTTTGIHDDHIVATLPTIDSETAPPNEFIQIRKHFETSHANLQVGFGNVELLVLPNDPMCSILKYDYDEYIRQEERIQRVIALEQYNRSQRRKKRRRFQSSRQAQSSENLTQLPIAIIPDTEVALTKPDVTRPHLHIDTNLHNTGNTKMEAHDDDDEDDIFGCDGCCAYCDWNYDQYQWKRLSLFFAVLLVLASIIGTVHVVRCMDPNKKYLGWISFWIGIMFLLPIALWIHRIMIACHRWSESEPEKQGYIVQSSTVTSFNNNNNGELEPTSTTNHKNTISTIPTNTATTLPSMMTLADACMRPSCADMMDDVCDPHCRNHTVTNPQNTSKSRLTQTEFSYVVPEMSGCYFIHYPKKDHYHHHHHRNSTSTTKHKGKAKHVSNTNPTVARKPSLSVSGVIVENENVVSSNGIENSGMPSDDDPNVWNASQEPQLRHDSASSSTTSCIMESESSVSSISSNDDPTMKELSIWNSMIHDI